VVNSGAPDLSRKNISGGSDIKGPIKIIEKLSVNSRCNRIYKYGIITPKKLIATTFVLVIEPIKNKK
jgi:hypothetical protein